MLDSALLRQYFHEWNQRSFQGALPPLELRWNARLRASAGLFRAGRRSLVFPVAPRIEIAAYLMDLPDGQRRVWDTLGHELIHYWLWVRRRPHGHTGEFLRKMREMGVSRYNDLPKPGKRTIHRYRCGGCQVVIEARRRYRKKVACLACCRRWNRGYYDERFRWVYVGSERRESVGSAGRSTN